MYRCSDILGRDRENRWDCHPLYIVHEEVGSLEIEVHHQLILLCPLLLQTPAQPFIILIPQFVINSFILWCRRRISQRFSTSTISSPLTAERQECCCEKLVSICHFCHSFKLLWIFLFFRPVAPLFRGAVTCCVFPISGHGLYYIFSSVDCFICNLWKGKYVKLSFSHLPSSFHVQACTHPGKCLDLWSLILKSTKFSLEDMRKYFRQD